MPWTEFHDMHSGGGQKLKWPRIYIEAGEEEAQVIFQNLFGRNPNRVTCTCCGPDYSMSTSDTLLRATAYMRGSDYDEDKPSTHQFNWYPYRPLAEFLQDPHFKFVYASDIKEEDRRGELTAEGYIWAGGDDE